MKKFISVVLLLALCLSLTACSSSKEDPQVNNDPGEVIQTAAPTIAPATEPMAVSTEAPEVPEAEAVSVPLGGSISHDKFTMTFESVEVLDEYSYRTSDYSTTSLYVEDGYKLLMLKGHFENLGTSAISDSSFKFTVTVNDEYVVDGFDVRLNFLRSKYFEIDPYTDMDYVLYINIPNKLAEKYESAVFTIAFNNDLSIPMTIWQPDGSVITETDLLYSVSTNGQAPESGNAPQGPQAQPPQSQVNTNQTISIGQTIVTDEFEFTLTGVELSYEVLPPNTSSVYTSYVAESGKVYVHVSADVKNLLPRDLRINELFTASVLYAGKYPYTGFTVVNDGDNDFDWVGSYVAATPLETCKAHSLVECPVEVDTSGKSILVTFVLAGVTYEFTLR